MRAMAKVLELKEECFLNQFDEKTSMYARFNYYPHCKRPDLVFGLKPHSDASAMTILLLDKEVGGLQVHKNAEWFDVPVLPNSLLVVVGDGMEVLYFLFCLQPSLLDIYFNYGRIPNEAENWSA